LPPYSYVPGLAPHPTSDERGHSFGRHEPLPRAEEVANLIDSPQYRFAIDLFNHGYYWEAHEAWESLWHAAGRRGPTADFLKGLIKLAAAGVKAREASAAGVQRHAARAEALFRAALRNPADDRDEFEDRTGLDASSLMAAAAQIAAAADQLIGDQRPQASRRLPLVLRLSPVNERPA
jgi:predicted metal-dependent hydrolase